MARVLEVLLGLLVLAFVGLLAWSAYDRGWLKGLFGGASSKTEKQEKTREDREKRDETEDKLKGGAVRKTERAAETAAGAVGSVVDLWGWLTGRRS